MKKKFTLRQNGVDISYLTWRDWSFSVWNFKTIVKKKTFLPLTMVVSLCCGNHLPLRVHLHPEPFIIIVMKLSLLLFRAKYLSFSVLCLFWKDRNRSFLYSRSALNLLNFLMNCLSLFCSCVNWIKLHLLYVYFIFIYFLFLYVQKNYDVDSNIASG